MFRTLLKLVPTYVERSSMYKCAVCFLEETQ